MEFVVPRDEHELVRIFGDLLFDRWEKAPKRGKNKEPTFSDSGMFFIERTGILNRVFRRWFGTTWGRRNWSRDFSGETPRQELVHHNPDFGLGKAYLSVKLLRSDETRDVAPYLLSRAMLEAQGGLIVYGLHQLGKGRRTPFHEPYFDPDFRRFANWLWEGEQQAKRFSSHRLPAKAEERYWGLFWVQCGAILAYALMPLLLLPKRELMALAGSFQDIFELHAAEQGGKADDFIDVDTLLFDLWGTLRRKIAALLPFEQAVVRKTDSQERPIKRAKNPRVAYSIALLYQLGVALDEGILFPADRYFGGLEAVWTNIDNFGRDLGFTIVVANNGGKLPKEMRPAIEEDEVEGPLAETVGQSALDIKRLWFVPPTAFRFLDSVRQYVI